MSKALHFHELIARAASKELAWRAVAAAGQMAVDPRTTLDWDPRTVTEREVAAIWQALEDTRKSREARIERQTRGYPRTKGAGDGQARAAGDDGDDEEATGA